MFDKSALLANDPMFEDIDAINLAIARVRALQRERVPFSDKNDFTLIQNQMEIFFQVYIRRALMLVDGAKLTLESGYGLLTITAVRSLFETAACIHDCCNCIIKHLDAGEVDEAIRQVHQRSYSQRFAVAEMKTEHFDYTAINVLKQIDAMGKTVPHARRSYEQLSESVHPNACGALLYFMGGEEDGHILLQQEEDRERLMGMLLAGASLFSLIYDDHLRFYSRIAKFAADELQKKIDDYEARKRATQSLSG